MGKIPQIGRAAWMFGAPGHPVGRSALGLEKEISSGGSVVRGNNGEPPRGNIVKTKRKGQ